jgi:lipid II:glycine glycyltransferase (peptidoglycan interpeptide bridge formation enzyme)
MENYHHFCQKSKQKNIDQEENKQALLLGQENRQDSVFSALALNLSTTIFLHIFYYIPFY